MSQTQPVDPSEPRREEVEPLVLTGSWGQADELTPDTDEHQAAASWKAQPRAGERGRTMAIVLAFVLGGLTLLCAGGLGVAYVSYDKATRIDRSTPGVSVRQYLHATLEDRDEARARLFTCRESARLAPVGQLLAEIKGKEAQFDVKIRTAVEDFDTATAGETATLRAKVRLSVNASDGFQEQIQNWQFSLKNQSGWRVCEAQRVG